MSSLLEMVTQQLGGNTLRQMSQTIGADENKTQTAVSAALPALLGALTRKASKPEGAEALAGALAKDHDGGILDDLGGFLNNFQSGPGDGILKHVLGGKRTGLETGLSKSTGLDTESVGKLLTMLAPVVLGVLGKQKRQQGIDTNGLSSMMQQERQQLEKTSPGGLGALTSFLDSDQDGDVDLGDLAKGGAGIFGKLMGGR